MVGCRIPSREPPCSYLYESLLDFDPVDEWLSDPDPFVMSISEAKDVKIELQDNAFVDGSESMVAETGMHEKLNKVRLDSEIEIQENAFVDGSESIVAETGIHEKLNKVRLDSEIEIQENAFADGSESIVAEIGIHEKLNKVRLDSEIEIQENAFVDGNESIIAETGIHKKLNEARLDSEIDGGGAIAVSDNKVAILEDGKSLVGVECNRYEKVNLFKEEIEAESSESSKSDDSKSDDESSSEEESSSSSSSSEEEDKDDESDEDEMDGVNEVGEGEVVVSSDDEGLVVAKEPIKSKNEIEDLPPVPPIDVRLEPHHHTFPVGVISSILGNRVIVEGSTRHDPLSEGSILWITVTRSPLGAVDEIFGPVKNPFYVVRYNSDGEIPGGIKEGTNVSFVVEFANHVLNEKDLYRKGYDASGENDEEIPDEVEFSDDEKEAEYKRSLRQKKRANDHKEGGRESAANKKRDDYIVAGTTKNVRNSTRRGPAANHKSSPGVSVSSRASSRTSSSGCGKCSSSPLGHQQTSVNAFPLQPANMQALQTGACLNPSSSQPLQWPQSSVLAQGLPMQQQPNTCGFGMPLQQQQPQVWSQNMLPQQQLNAWGNGLVSQQHQNALAPGFLPQLQLMGLFGGCQMNNLRNLQVLDQTQYQHHQNQHLITYPNAMSSQQQLLPNSGVPLGAQWLGGAFNFPNYPMNAGLVGQNGGFSQPQVACSNMNDPQVSGLFGNQTHGHDPAIVQTEPHCLQFNPGKSSDRGRKPHTRGGRHSFGRGNTRRS